LGALFGNETIPLPALAGTTLILLGAYFTSRGQGNAGGVGDG